MNGGIGGNKEDAGHILFSCHSEDDLPLSQLYPEVIEGESRSDTAVPEEFKEDCSRIPYLSTTMAAPFLSVATGALLVAGCAQRALRLKTDTNYIKFDMLKFQKAYQREKKKIYLSRNSEDFQKKRTA